MGDITTPHCCGIIQPNKQQSIPMKSTSLRLLFCTFAPLASAISLASADLVMVSETKIGEVKSLTTMFISGSMMRTDNGTDSSVIIDTKTGDMTTLMHEQKMVVKVNMAQLKALAAPNAPAPGPESVTKITAMGKTQKVDGYDCELYLSENMGTKVSMWIAKDYPGYDKLKAELAAVKNLNPGGAKQPEVPGMALRTEYTANGMTFVTSVVSLKEQKVDSALFQVPGDYKAPGV